MNTKVEQAEQAVTAADVAKYVLAAALVVGGIVAFYHFSQWPGPVRALLAAAGVVAAGAVVAAAHGRRLPGPRPVWSVSPRPGFHRAPREHRRATAAPNITFSMCLLCLQD
mgnify:CR=1 FL=1